MRTKKTYDRSGWSCTTEFIIAMSTFSLVSLLSGLLLAYNHSDLQKVDDTPVVAAVSVFD